MKQSFQYTPQTLAIRDETLFSQNNVPQSSEFTLSREKFTFVNPKGLTPALDVTVGTLEKRFMDAVKRNSVVLRLGLSLKQSLSFMVWAIRCGKKQEVSASPGFVYNQANEALIKMQPMTSAGSASQKLNTRAILDAVLDGRVLAAAEALHLLRIDKPEELERLQNTSDEIRKRQSGETVTYDNRCSLYLTNLDELKPTLASYTRQPGDSGAFILSIDDIDATLESAIYRQTRKVYISGGGFWSHLQIPGLESPTLLKTYIRLLTHIREKYPTIALEGFSPDEIDFLHVISDRSEQYILEMLKDLGLRGLGGNQTGILADAVRKKISPRLTRVKHWFEIVARANRLEIPVALHLEAGHFETLQDRISHLTHAQNFLKRHPGAFSRLIPSMWTRPVQNLENQPGVLQSSLKNRQKLLAVSRLFLGEQLPCQQVFWLPEQTAEAQEGLQWGANDFGTTDSLFYPEFLAGSRNPTLLNQQELATLIQETGRKPASLSG
jgi:2-iminoacetate synthase ThiH